MVRSCVFITLFVACSSQSSPAQPNGSVDVERSGTYGFTSVAISDALTIPEVGMDGTTIATGDFVEIAGADRGLFDAGRTG